MKKFLLNLTKFVLYPIIIFILVDTLINLSTEHKSLNDLIDEKIEALPIKNNQINIIIAGDSRAERQLIPKIIKEKTGINTINIAVSSGDVVSTIAAIKEKFSESKCIFIISASSWQINDGAIDAGYLSEKCFQQATSFDKIVLYKDNVVGFTKMYGRLINQAIKVNYSTSEDIKKPIDNDGFLGINGKIKKFSTQAEMNDYIKRHKYYKNFENDRIRWKIFQKSLQDLDNLETISFVIQPPLSPYGHKVTKNSIIQKSELEYSKKITSLKFKNIKCLDFYSNNISTLTDDMYYDLYHLNDKGAIIYSKLIANLVLNEVKNNNKFNNFE